MFDSREKLLDDVSDYDNENDIEMCDDTDSNVEEVECTFVSLVELAETFALSRSEADFAKLYNGAKKRLYRHIQKFVGCNADDINTVLDNTMILIYCNIDKYDSDKSRFQTWMYTIARNEAISYLRREGVRNGNIISTDFGDLYDSSVMVEDNSYECSDGPLSYVSEDEGFLDIVWDNNRYITYTKELAINTFFSLVNDALDSMRDVNRIVFNQRVLKDKKVKDVALLIGVADRSVKRYYATSKKDLYDYLVNNNPYVYELIKEVY